MKGWLDENTLLVQKNSFHSSDSFLDLNLYLTQLPVQAGTPTTMTHPLAVTFGNQIRLLGYDLGQPYTAGGALPVTLYWQTTQKTEQQYKYILQMVAPNAAGVPQVLALTERQPYDGIVPTNLWEPGKTIMEYSWLSPVDFSGQPTRPVQLTLQVYRADTLEKAPITASPTTAVRNDEMTLVLLQSTTDQLMTTGSMIK